MRNLIMMAAGALLSTSLPVSAVPPQSDAAKKGLDVLRRSAAALKELETASYQAEVSGTGWMADRVLRVKGRGVLGRRTESGAEPFRMILTLTTTDTNERIEYEIGTNGKVHFVKDLQTHMVYENEDEGVFGPHGEDMKRLLMHVYTDPEPFSAAIQSGSVKLAAQENVGEEPCKSVLIKRKHGPAEKWLISKRDWLPRKRIRIHPNPDGKGAPGTTELMVTFLIHNPRYSKDPFKVVVTEPFIRVGGFAP